MRQVTAWYQIECVSRWMWLLNGRRLYRIWFKKLIKTSAAKDMILICDWVRSSKHANLVIKYGWLKLFRHASSFLSQNIFWFWNGSCCLLESCRLLSRLLTKYPSKTQKKKPKKPQKPENPKKTKKKTENPQKKPTNPKNRKNP